MLSSRFFFLSSVPSCTPVFIIFCAHLSILFSQLCASSQFSFFMHCTQFCQCCTPFSNLGSVFFPLRLLHICFHYILCTVPNSVLLTLYQFSIFSIFLCTILRSASAVPLSRISILFSFLCAYSSSTVHVFLTLRPERWIILYLCVCAHAFPTCFLSQLFHPFSVPSSQFCYPSLSLVLSSVSFAMRLLFRFFPLRPCISEILFSSVLLFFFGASSQFCYPNSSTVLRSVFLSLCFVLCSVFFPLQSAATPHLFSFLCPCCPVLGVLSLCLVLNYLFPNSLPGSQFFYPDSLSVLSSQLCFLYSIPSSQFFYPYSVPTAQSQLYFLTLCPSTLSSLFSVLCASFFPQTLRPVPNIDLENNQLPRLSHFHLESRP
jgi:hypothetical protein